METDLEATRRVLCAKTHETTQEAARRVVHSKLMLKVRLNHLVKRLELTQLGNELIVAELRELLSRDLKESEVIG